MRGNFLAGEAGVSIKPRVEREARNPRDVVCLKIKLAKRAAARLKSGLSPASPAHSFLSIVLYERHTKIWSVSEARP